MHDSHHRHRHHHHSKHRTQTTVSIKTEISMIFFCVLSANCVQIPKHRTQTTQKSIRTDLNGATRPRGDHPGPYSSFPHPYAGSAGEVWLR